jgi:hypothetical protein
VLPIGPDSTLPPSLLIAVVVLYVLSLAPTFVVAGSARVMRGTSADPTGRRTWKALAGGALVAGLGSAPTLLVVGLAAQLHGRAAVALGVGAFTLGSLAAPWMVGWAARRIPIVCAWPLYGAVMIAGWALAPWHVAGLIVAQLAAGLAFTSFEASMDAWMVRDTVRGSVTGRLAAASSARALGSALAVTAAPAVFDRLGLASTSAWLGLILVGMGLGPLAVVGTWLRLDVVRQRRAEARPTLEVATAPAPDLL